MKGINKGKRALHAVLICQGIKGLGDNPEQISLIHVHKEPSGEKQACLGYIILYMSTFINQYKYSHAYLKHDYDVDNIN